jgi:uncharacterized protein Yka (UPF0111/DUF47 family)
MPFFKRTTTLFDTQLELLASKVVSAAEAVVEMIDHPEHAAQHAQTVSDLEHSADRIVRETFALQMSSLGSVERSDLMNLLERVDDIVDIADATAQRLWLHQVGAPTPEAKQLGEVFLQAAKAVQALVNTLRKLREPHHVLDLCLEINRLEAKGDEVYRQAMLSLFSGKHDAMHIVKWKDVYERLERSVNKCEDVAKLIEGLVQAIA